MNDPEANAPSAGGADAPAVEPEVVASPAVAEVPSAASGPVAAAVALPEPTGDLLFDTLWKKVLADWDDDKAHGSILEYAVTAERLPDLAGHYRALKDDAVKGARAQKRLDAIIVAATQLMMSMKTPVSTTIPLPITLSVFGLFLCAVAFVAYAMMHR